ncbi:hypothetical protein D5018_19650 [Parashewanella curva]|uniref:Uncharacterized protein n=2 Tax=Parashewanella curva TaxID=2338552 RepID=A0A3L8PRF2_9GAMM|nr:hypothetical protein D5018_19650 [Parashewanella curva]
MSLYLQEHRVMLLVLIGVLAFIAYRHARYSYSNVKEKVLAIAIMILGFLGHSYSLVKDHLLFRGFVPDSFVVFLGNHSILEVILASLLLLLISDNAFAFRNRANGSKISN